MTYHKKRRCDLASPFPGMDPFLEDPEIWMDFHHALAEEIRGQLNTRLSPRYYAGVEAHTVMESIGIGLLHTTSSHAMRPDIGVFEPFEAALMNAPSAPTAFATRPAPVRRLVTTPSAFKVRAVRIYETDTSTLVTSIEVLSPANKRGEGLEQYRYKRSQLLDSTVHLLEIDLLRGGTRPGPELHNPTLDTDYVLLVNRAGVQRISEIWPIALNETLPELPVPLLEPDPDVPLDLNAALANVYVRARYEQRLNYHRPTPAPQLRAAMAEWANELLSEQAKR